MKIRFGWVSNSSSSSFIIRDDNFKNKEDINKLIDIYIWKIRKRK